MKIRFVARKFTLTDDVKERVQKKLQKLDKFFSSDTEAAVALYGEKIGERIEVTIYHGGHDPSARKNRIRISPALWTRRWM